ncbi:MAG: hypothetical protein ABIA93_04220 [Candidatus Woesearchaeota archaeon]
MKTERILGIVGLMVLLLASQVSAVTTLISPSDNAVTNSKSFTFNTDLTNATCSLMIDGQPSGTTNPQQGVSTSINTNVQDGQHAWTVSCIATNVTESPNARQVTIDTTIPAVTAISPAPGTTVPAGTVSFQVSAIDALSPALSCVLLADGVESASKTGTGNITMSISMLNAGTHSWQVRCTDRAGNSGSSSIRNIVVQAPPFLNLQLDQAEYSLGSAPKLTISAKKGADVQLYLFSSDQAYQDFIQQASGFCYDCEVLTPIVDGTYPVTRTLSARKKAGTQWVYATTEDDSIKKALSFTVNNNIALSVEGHTSIEAGSDTTLTAIATGGIQPLNYSWKLHNNTILKGNKIDLKKLSAGSYIEKITVTDNAGNQLSKDITVKVEKTYTLTLTVKRQDTGAVIGDAAISYGNNEAKTSSSGIATIKAPAGTWKLFVSKTGFQSMLEDVKIDKNMSYEVRLELSQTEQQKSIVLLTPSTGASLQPGTINFAYRTDGYTNAQNCSVMLSNGDNWFQAIDNRMAQPGKEQTVSTILSTGTYRWNVICGSTTSDTRTITVSNASTTLAAATNAVSSTEDQQTDPLKDELEKAYDTYDSFSVDQKKAADILGFKDRLDLAITAILRGARDSHDVAYRRDLSEKEKEDARQNIIKEIENLRSTVPIDIAVAKQSQYVSFVKDEEIIAFTKENPDILPSDLSKNDIQKLIALQGRLSVSTTVMHLTLKYADGKQEEVTLVHKKIATNETQGTRLVEIIPKDIVQSASRVKVLSKNFQVLKDDPVFGFALADSITYMIPGTVEIHSIENTATLLLPVEGTSFAKFTGAATGTVRKPGIDSKIMLIVLVLLLAGLYAGYYFDGFTWIRQLARIHSADQSTHIGALVQNALDALAQDNYDTAMLIYREITLEFERMDPTEQNKVFEDTVLLCNQLDMHYIQDVIKRIDQAVRQNDINMCRDEYPKMQGAFERLPPEHQRNIHGEIVRVNKLIAERSS